MTKISKSHILAKASAMRIIKVHGRKHVITDAEDRSGTTHRESNYRGTGCALIGILDEDEPLDLFIKRWIKRTSIIHGVD